MKEAVEILAQCIRGQLAGDHDHIARALEGHDPNTLIAVMTLSFRLNADLLSAVAAYGGRDPYDAVDDLVAGVS